MHDRQWVCGTVAFLVLAHSAEQAAALFELSHGRLKQFQRRCSKGGHSVGVLLRRAGFGQEVGLPRPGRSRRRTGRRSSRYPGPARHPDLYSDSSSSPGPATEPGGTTGRSTGPLHDLRRLALLVKTTSLPFEEPAKLPQLTLPATCRCFQNSPVPQDGSARLPPFTLPITCRDLQNPPVSIFLFLPCLPCHRRPPRPRARLACPSLSTWCPGAKTSLLRAPTASQEAKRGILLEENSGTGDFRRHRKFQKEGRLSYNLRLAPHCNTRVRSHGGRPGTSISPRCRPPPASGPRGFRSPCRSAGRSAGGWPWLSTTTRGGRWALPCSEANRHRSKSASSSAG